MDIDNVEVIEYIDNGFTGTNFERPAFQEMLDDIQCSKIQCIVCKDFSRFGREAIETGYFIDHVFPILQIRFISVDDDYDSIRFDGDTAGIDINFKYILHERYSRDLSLKVKSAKLIKMREGKNIVANAIYGYRKGNSGCWEIDEEAANVVKTIFQMALDGYPTAKIRNKIFADNIPTPREYSELKREKDITPSCMWTARMIRHILSNEQYIGTYVAGKQVSKAIGSHSKIHTDKKDWIMLPDWHPYIICKTMFHKVQDIMRRNNNSTTTKPLGNLLQDDVNRPRRSLMISGERKPNNPIYGYTKDKNGDLIVDEAVASIIRDIYLQASENVSVKEIRDTLTDKCYPVPSEHIKMSKGHDITPSCKWTNKSVRSILQNVQYTGAYVSGKILKDYNTGKKYHTAQSDWVIIPDQNPPIVSNETFDAVQKILTNNRHKRKNMQPQEYLLRGGILKCGCCGYALAYDSSNEPVFRCQHTQADTAAACHKMKVNVHEVDNAILQMIELQIQVMLGFDATNVRKIKHYEGQIISYKELLSKRIREQQHYYEEYIEQKISREEYLDYRKSNEMYLEKLNQQLSFLKSKKGTELNRKMVVATAKTLVNKSASPRELVETLIKRVSISPGNQLEVEWLIASGHTENEVL